MYVLGQYRRSTDEIPPFVCACGGVGFGRGKGVSLVMSRDSGYFLGRDGTKTANTNVSVDKNNQ